jgi:regulator of replication initiation timing
MNSDDIRKFRVIKKKLLTTVAENKRLKGENEKLKEENKRLEKEVRSKTNGEGKKEKKQINPDDFGKPKSLQDI